MVNKEHIMLLNDELKKILQLELQAGNTIAETAICGFSKTKPDHLFVFLEKPFFDSSIKIHFFLIHNSSLNIPNFYSI